MSRRSLHEVGARTAQHGADSTCRHDTEKLPCGGFYFAPGAIDCMPSRPRKRLAGWQRLVLEVAAWLAVAGLIGFTAGVLQAKGWPL